MAESPFHILLVEDDASVRDAVAASLRDEGYAVATAADGQEAINLVENTEDLSLVLMDVMMPEMDGYETMRAIRARPEFQSLPIIALTAKAMKGDRENCIDAGASDYIAKPAEPEQLLSLLRVWLYA